MKFLKLFLIFLMPTFAFAEYTFIVENTAMVDTYFNIFNAIAALFENDNYIELLRLVFLVGGFFVFAGGVLSAGESGGSGKILAPYVKYTLVGVAILIMMFSNKDTMIVSTNNLPGFCSTASTTTGTGVEMPAVLAYFFTLTNKIGTNLTYMAEAAFSTPNSNGTATMSDSGGFLGSLKQTINLLGVNPNKITNFKNKDDAGEFELLIQASNLDFLTMWQSFFARCVYEVAQNKGLAGDKVLNELRNSKDINTWVGNYLTTNPYSETSNYAPRDYLIQINGQHTTCGTYYEELKKVNDVLKDKTACALPLAHGGTIELLTAGSGNGVVSELQGIALQSGLLNALSSSKIMSSIGISGADYAAGKSRAESNMENLAGAQYMAQMLPYIQMTMRAVLYAFFPFVFITILLPGGLKVLAQYAQTLIWIELWSPTAAIVNMFVNMQVKSTVGDTYSSQGLTLMSSVDMLSEANTIAGVGAMLYLSIPALTWLILKGSGQMLGNLTTGISGKFAKNLESRSVAQDMGELEKQKISNARREKAGMAALSYGEMMHYESTLKGAHDAGSLAAQMKAGHLSVANSSELDGASKYETASREMKVAGGLDAAVNTKATNASKQLGQTQEELRALGIMDNKGNMNLENLRKYNGASGAINAAKEMANDTNLNKFLTKNGLTDNPANRDKFANYVGKTMGTEEFIKTASSFDVQNINSDKDRIDSNVKNESVEVSANKKVLDSYNGNMSENIKESSDTKALTERTENKTTQEKKNYYNGYDNAVNKEGESKATNDYISTNATLDVKNKIDMNDSAKADARSTEVNRFSQLTSSTSSYDEGKHKSNKTDEDLKNYNKEMETYEKTIYSNFGREIDDKRIGFMNQLEEEGFFSNNQIDPKTFNKNLNLEMIQTLAKNNYYNKDLTFEAIKSGVSIDDLKDIGAIEMKDNVTNFRDSYDDIKTIRNEKGSSSNEYSKALTEQRALFNGLKGKGMNATGVEVTTQQSAIKNSDVSKTKDFGNDTKGADMVSFMMRNQQEDHQFIAKMARQEVDFVVNWFKKSTGGGKSPKKK